MRVKELPFTENGLRRHVLITGSTGSGKTVAARYIIKQAAIYGVPSIVIDAQGDISSLVLRTRVGISVKARPRPRGGGSVETIASLSQKSLQLLHRTRPPTV